MKLSSSVNQEGKIDAKETDFSLLLRYILSLWAICRLESNTCTHMCATRAFHHFICSCTKDFGLCLSLTHCTAIIITDFLLLLLLLLPSIHSFIHSCISSTALGGWSSSKPVTLPFLALHPHALFTVRVTPSSSHWRYFARVIGLLRVTD